MIRLGAPTKLPAVVEQTAARKSQTLAAVTRVTFYALAACRRGNPVGLSIGQINHDD